MNITQRQQQARTLYNRAAALQLTERWYRTQVRHLVLEPMMIDIDHDSTTHRLINHHQLAKGYIISKAPGVVAGLAEIKWATQQLGISCTVKIGDGKYCKPGNVLAKLTGSARILLGVERTMLNTLQRLSGIATSTHRIVQKIGPYPLVAATRKTILGPLDKRAVVTGGGYSHRLGLADGILVKDNHWALVDATIIVKKHWPKGRLRIIEIASRRQLHTICTNNADIDVILFDNFSQKQLHAAMTWLKQQRYYQGYLFEASGGITFDNCLAYARSGVDVISVGSLTHSAPALDVSFEIVP
ncbi:MAG: carboxylating nicotinate-nucleotide diphosphorylase [Candidatus Kerfeldbacteria bacterium]|nr:carboxylating nicotinate-nucleotide diphosphorylase [Candidatus Kerfeldbacteria bacterium]